LKSKKSPVPMDRPSSVTSNIRALAVF